MSNLPEANDGWMQTFTGRAFRPLDPNPDDVCIEDIAHHLSLLCRFGGACSTFYSVAEHSIRMVDLVSRIPAGPTLKLQALLHDAAEAYLVDVPRPIKRQLSEYKPIEQRVMRAIGEAFDVELELLPDEIKHLDNVLLATEKRDLMKPMRVWEKLPPPVAEIITPWTDSRVAEGAFIATFGMLDKMRRVGP